ncbi:MAG: NosD domain-containing protein [Thermodesulfobacteriota bacterium]
MNKTFWLMALVAAALLTAGPVGADGDFYVIAGGGAPGIKIKHLPYTISAPGFYYLGGNLTCPSGTGITVDADDVTLDLMGFCLSGTSSGFGVIIINGHKNVEVRHGSLRGWWVAVEENTAGVNHRFINLRMEGNVHGIDLCGKGHLVKGCASADNTNFGIRTVGGSTATISGNVAVNNGSYGIQVGGAGSVIGNNVTSNIVSQTCFSLYSEVDPVLMDQNTASGPGTHYLGGNSATVWGTNAGR